MKVTRRRRGEDGGEEVKVFDTAERGLECRACGCRHFLTIKTIRVSDHVRRVRVCRNCGTRARTVERFMS